MTMRWKTGWTCALLAFAAAFAAVLPGAFFAPLRAQEPDVEELDLPRHVADDIIAFFNRASTIRFQGRAVIPAGSSVTGDVAVLGGPVTVAGEILGDLVVVNGTLTVVEGGRVSGDVTVVGGEADVEVASVGGQLTVYEEALTYERRGDRIAYDESPWRRWEERRRHGRTWFSVRSAGNYNRVEGLPVLLGPVFQTRGEDPFRLDVTGIWKSESGIRLAPRELGYLFRAEQHFGPSGRFSVGGTAHSMVDPIDTNGLRDIEASLAAFLLHRDYRDYFERQGFSGYLRYEEPASGLRLGLEYGDDEHSFVPVGSPWTLKRNDAPWRAQPLVAEGRLRSVTSSVLVDARNDQDDPTDGWYLEARATLGLGGSLTLPEYLTPEGQPSQVAQDARPVDTDFSTGLLDLRRYARLGPGADLRLRGYLAGSLGGGPLPPQFQRTLGGEGSLPGHPLMTLDCGARDASYSVLREVDEERVRMPVYAGYGCDRVALFQVEYRGDLFFDFDFGPGDNWDDDWDWYPVVNLHPSWSVFFDAGRGWSLANPLSPAYLGPSSDTLMDLGFGFLLGDVGLYWAWPLSGRNKDANFFLRIDHRF